MSLEIRAAAAAGGGRRGRGEAARLAARRLDAAGVPSALHDAQALLAFVLGIGRHEIHAGAREPLSSGDAERYSALVDRRAGREPLQTIVGSTGFRGLDLAVRPGVFVPRPDTETLAGSAIEAVLASGAREPLVLEIGTGTGAVALSIAAEVALARVVATDVSAEAVALAAQNARRAGLAGRVRFARADLFAGIGAGGVLFDAVVANPPYIREGDIADLMPEVRLWDPEAALRGGPDGMRYHEAIAAGAIGRLVPGGTLHLEVGDGQAGAVAALLGRLGYAGVRVSRDLAGTERVVSATRPSD